MFCFLDSCRHLKKSQRPLLLYFANVVTILLQFFKVFKFKCAVLMKQTSKSEESCALDIRCFKSELEFELHQLAPLLTVILSLRQECFLLAIYKDSKTFHSSFLGLADGQSRKQILTAAHSSLFTLSFVLIDFFCL